MTNGSVEVVIAEEEEQLDNLLRLFPDLNLGKTKEAIGIFGRRNKGSKPLILPNLSVNGDYQDKLLEAFLQLKRRDGNFAETCSTLPRLKRVESYTLPALRKAGCLQGGDFIVLPHRLVSLPAGRYCRNNGMETIGRFVHLPLLHLCWLILAGNVKIEEGEGEIVCSGDRLSAIDLCRVITVKKQGGLKIKHECPNAQFKRAMALVCRPL